MTKRVLFITASAHFLVIGALVFVSTVKRKVKEEPKHEVVAWVQMHPERVVQPPVVKPRVVEPAVVKPVPPKPVKEKAPEVPLKPVRTLKKANEIKISKRKVKRQQEVKPRPRPTPRPKVRPPTAEEIRRTLATQVPVQRTATSSGEPDMTFFYSMVKEKMYGAWRQPSGLGSRFMVEVKIRVARSGVVTQRTLVRSSGHALVDQSAMKAARSVRHIVALPAGFSGAYKDVTVEFEIQNAE